MLVVDCCSKEGGRWVIVTVGEPLAKKVCEFRMTAIELGRRELSIRVRADMSGCVVKYVQDAEARQNCRMKQPDRKNPLAQTADRNGMLSH